MMHEELAAINASQQLINWIEPCFLYYFVIVNYADQPPLFCVYYYDILSFPAKFSIELLLYKHQHSLQKIFIVVYNNSIHAKQLAQLADYSVDLETMGLGIEPRTANVTVFPGEMMAIWPWTTMFYHGLPCSTMDYHVLPSTTIDYHVLPSTTMDYYGLPWTTMDYHGLPWLLWSYNQGLPWYEILTMVDYGWNEKAVVDCASEHGFLWLAMLKHGWPPKTVLTMVPRGCHFVWDIGLSI